MVICPLGLHAYVYGAVPPLAEAVASPSHAPKQVTSVLSDTTTTGPEVLLTEAITESMQPSASVTTTCQAPADKFVAVDDVCPSSQVYVNDGTPLVIVTVADPSDWPQVAAVVAVLRIIATGSLTVIELLAIHPLVSVTVRVYVAAHSPTAVAVVCADGSSHRYVYGGVPPDKAPEASPSQTPLQLASLPLIAIAIAVGSVITMESTVTTKLLSVTVTTYVLAHNPIIEGVVIPPGDQEYV
jgi:hypothetical protein